MLKGLLDQFRVNSVFVPYRGFRFLMLSSLYRERRMWDWVFVPYRGFRFLIRKAIKANSRIILVFVPYRGFRFLISYDRWLWGVFSSVFVPYRGFRFLILIMFSSLSPINVFVPYRGFRFLISVVIITFISYRISFSSPIGVFVF